MNHVKSRRPSPKVPQRQMKLTIEPSGIMNALTVPAADPSLSGWQSSLIEETLLGEESKPEQSTPKALHLRLLFWSYGTVGSRTVLQTRSEFSYIEDLVGFIADLSDLLADAKRNEWATRPWQFCTLLHAKGAEKSDTYQSSIKSLSVDIFLRVPFSIAMQFTASRRDQNLTSHPALRFVNGQLPDWNTIGNNMGDRPGTTHGQGCKGGACAGDLVCVWLL
ncbi:hypothetical protein P175DRAFT_0527354 [Aspergillus ochraceoroseus IBT 24754]|uniref:Uncharacterized protein n=1 Tax=Aspergillus ochraceoroseus IBT 24754 TaxID=1392256 RepID=A0A2T5M5T8_9EURO|nr:uncharacterized protein P175DRAFT_0527354 [Aspergillus ochraceoroseus IBT 24754]PTU23897.1 hypothetical protein P175DRAFT_0527354 [Aspergillus ochraceoroseus IBT 24754]